MMGQFTCIRSMWGDKKLILVQKGGHLGHELPPGSLGNRKTTPRATPLFSCCLPPLFLWQNTHIPFHCAGAETLTPTLHPQSPPQPVWVMAPEPQSPEQFLWTVYLSIIPSIIFTLSLQHIFHLTLSMHCEVLGIHSLFLEHCLLY